MNLPRDAITTISFIDQYCAAYQDLFPEVRSFECFKFLHLGMISELKRKSLPAIALIGWSKQCTTFASLYGKFSLGCKYD